MFFFNQRFFILKDLFCFPLKPWVRNLRSQNWLGHIFCGPFFGVFNQKPTGQGSYLVARCWWLAKQWFGIWQRGGRTLASWTSCLLASEAGDGGWRPSRKKWGGTLKGKVRFERKGWFFGEVFFSWGKCDLYKTLQWILTVDRSWCCSSWESIKKEYHQALCVFYWL